MVVLSNWKRLSVQTIMWFGITNGLLVSSSHAMSVQVKQTTFMYDFGDLFVYTIIVVEYRDNSVTYLD